MTSNCFGWQESGQESDESRFYDFCEYWYFNSVQRTKLKQNKSETHKA